MAAKKSSRRTKKNNGYNTVDRRFSILLFAAGLLFICLSFIPGESGWAWLRQNILFGAFGVSGWLIGPLFIWWAVLVGLGQPVFSSVIRGLFMLIALSGLVMAFGAFDISGLSFTQALRAMHLQGKSELFSGGLLGLVLGGTLYTLGGKIVARVLMVLLLIISIMVFAGISPADIYSSLSATWQNRPQGDSDEKALRKERRQLKKAKRKERRQLKKARRKERKEHHETQRKQQAERREKVQITPPRRAAASGTRRTSPSVDVSLGPDARASERGKGEGGEVEVGPGGTFGMNPLKGAKESYTPPQPINGSTTGDVDLVFDFHSRTNGASPANGELPGDDMLLFGDDDPYAAIGGADSRLRDANLPPVEYVPQDKPQADPGFDLFGGGGTAPQTNGESSSPSLFDQEAPPSAPDPVPDAFFDSPPLPQTPPPAPATGSSAPPQPPATPAAKTDTNGDTPKLDPAVNQLIDGVEAKRQASLKAEQQSAAQRPQEQEIGYRRPPIDLFLPAKVESDDNAREEMTKTADKLVKTLKSFNVETRILDISRGPTVTRYEVQPQTGVKISRITNLSDDIALNLAAAGVRIEAPIPGRPAVGIEVPNHVKNTVAMRGVLESGEFRNSTSPLPVALGKDITGDCVVADLTKMPHLLIAGATGSGKSVCINAIIMGFLYRSTPEQLRLILIDPKMVELAEYNGIPHLLMPVVTEPRKAAGALGSAVAEMEKRYKLFAENQVRDIHTYNKKAKKEELETMPHIAIIIDELADLMMTSGKEVEDYICRIAQKARAAGMHLIVATQRPSTDVITGLIKANIPSRIAFAVSSHTDSRIILDGNGAEKLLGMGDMLFMPVGANKPVRVQGTYVQDKEITEVLDFIKDNTTAQYDDDMIEDMERRASPDQLDDDDESMFDDPVFIEAIEAGLETDQMSTSFLQRRLRVGYARAGRMVDEMERLGFITPQDGSKPRDMLLTRDQWLEMNVSQDLPGAD